MADSASLADQAVETLSMVKAMCDGMDLGHPERHAVRNMQRVAELVLAMEMVTPRGLVARQLARRILGVDDAATSVPDTAAIVTNGTLRLLPRDEPVFLLRGQDALAPMAVREWVKAAKLNGIVIAAQQAERQAALMDAWKMRKMPDWPPSSHAA